MPKKEAKPEPKLLDPIEDFSLEPGDGATALLKVGKAEYLVDQHVVVSLQKQLAAALQFTY